MSFLQAQRNPAATMMVAASKPVGGFEASTSTASSSQTPASAIASGSGYRMLDTEMARLANQIGTEYRVHDTWDMGHGS